MNEFVLSNILYTISSSYSMRKRRYEKIKRTLMQYYARKKLKTTADLPCLPWHSVCLENVYCPKFDCGLNHYLFVTNYMYLIFIIQYNSSKKPINTFFEVPSLSQCFLHDADQKLCFRVV